MMVAEGVASTTIIRSGNQRLRIVVVKLQKEKMCGTF